MSRTKTLTAAIALAVGLAGPALAQEGKGKGHGNGNGHGGEAHGNPGRGHGGGDRDRGPGADRGRGHQMQAAVREAPRGPDVRRVEREVRDSVRDQRPVVVRGDDGDRVVFVRRDDRGLINGCPPGLAKKNNGCLPPGQARNLAVQTNTYNWLWDRRDDRYDYRYDNGYLYRVTPQGSLLGYVPVLGGALAQGQIWPAQYQYQPVPDYYTRYYGLNDQYAYRYADGALFGVDPQTQAIGQIAALLTGQQWNVGQAMPAGYDIYNVPYAYRNQYADSANSLYRYNDGYVYQVDPTTRLIQAAIQLLT